MRNIRKKRLVGILCGIVLCGLSACGATTSGGDEMGTPTSEVTVKMIPEGQGTEGTVTEQQEATFVPEATATPVPTPTPGPTHAPAKREGIMIPAEYRQMKKEYAGTVELISYKTKNYYGDGEEITKPAYVYLPYGYDETKQYNVLYLLHSAGGDEKEWGLHSQFSTVRLAMDNLIYYGDIEPFIIVTPYGLPRAGYNTEAAEEVDAAYDGFVTELRNDLIPYIEANYATYADYDEAGYDMAAARDHRAIAGGSFGAMQAIDIGMCECLDLFSYFGPFSPGVTFYEPEQIAEKIDSFEGYEIRCIYNVCGDAEMGYVNTSLYLLADLEEWTDKVVPGENLFLYIVKGTHNMETWNLAFYNFAQVVFE